MARDRLLQLYKSSQHQGETLAYLRNLPAVEGVDCAVGEDAQDIPLPVELLTSRLDQRFERGGCDSLRMAPSEAQKKLAYQAVITARDVELTGTEAHSPAATQLVDATQVSLAYTGVPATPTITDYPTTLAQAGQDAVRRPTADEVWSAADGWIDLAIAIAGIFGGTAGIAATQFLVKARQKSRALRQVISANEKLKEWLRLRGKDAELNAFYDMQNAYQKGRTEAIVAAERTRVKPERAPVPAIVKPPEPSMN